MGLCVRVCCDVVLGLCVRGGIVRTRFATSLGNSFVFGSVNDGFVLQCYDSIFVRVCACVCACGSVFYTYSQMLPEEEDQLMLKFPTAGKR